VFFIFRKGAGRKTARPNHTRGGDWGGNTHYAGGRS
jgi:hypothetical protein